MTVDTDQVKDIGRCDHCNAPHIRCAQCDVIRGMSEIFYGAVIACSGLRCLIDKVVIPRVGRDRVATRIVWKGGETTTTALPIPVGSLADLPGATEMEQIILERSVAGESDEAIADHLTQLGHRSPMRTTVLPSTV